MPNGETDAGGFFLDGPPDKPDGSMLELCGLRRSKTPSGKTVLQGNLGSVRLLIYENKIKENDQAPDFKLYATPGKSAGAFAPSHGVPKKVGDGFDWLRAAGPETAPTTDDADF